jgi:hypothetical protein
MSGSILIGDSFPSGIIVDIITHYKVAKKVLELLENSFNENQNKISIENIAEKIYKDDDFYT